MQRSEVLDKLRELAEETLELEPGKVTEDARFAEDLDTDSLDLVELVMEIENAFDIEIPEEELDGIETIGQTLDLIQEKLTP